MGRPLDRRITDETVLVVGLGLFGSATAKALVEMNVPVIAITDDHAQAVQYADAFTHVIEMNPSDREALDQIGVRQLRKAVVGLSKVELSIMTVLALAEAGVEEIWARAATKEHGAILERIGAHHVIYSEASTGRRVAHAVSGAMADYFEFEDGFAIARVLAPRVTWDKTLADSRVRTRNEVTVVGVKRRGQELPLRRARDADPLRRRAHRLRTHPRGGRLLPAAVGAGLTFQTRPVSGRRADRSGRRRVATGRG